MSEWFVPSAVPDAECPVYCFPYAGGGAQAFREYQNADSSFVALRYPGRESRIVERPFDRMEGLAAAIADELVPRIGGRYAFFGHSLGAKVAWAVMCELRSRGIALPCRLFVAGCGSPCLPEKRCLHDLDDVGFVRELRKYEATPEAILDNPDVLRFFMPMLRADFTISETWRADENLVFDIPVTAMHGRSDTEAECENVLAWKKLVSGNFEFIEFDGGHFFPFHKCPAVLRVMRSRVGSR